MFSGVSERYQGHEIIDDGFNFIKDTLKAVFADVMLSYTTTLSRFFCYKFTCAFFYSMFLMDVL